MIILYVIIGVMLAMAIARVNKSNKLFWAALLSFMIGIAAESIINKVSQKEENNPAQLCPTQVVSSTSNAFAFLADVPPTTQSLVPNLASQDTTPDSNRVVYPPTESFKETLTEPPDYHPQQDKSDSIK